MQQLLIRIVLSGIYVKAYNINSSYTFRCRNNIGTLHRYIESAQSLTHKVMLAFFSH